MTTGGSPDLRHPYGFGGNMATNINTNPGSDRITDVTMTLSGRAGYSVQQLIIEFKKEA